MNDETSREKGGLKYMQYIACFDIGGTYIKFALLNDRGDFIIKDKIHTPTNNTQNEIENGLCTIINDFQKKFPVSAVGISSCGIVDSKHGVVLLSANIPGYTGMKLAERIKKQLNLPVAVENDVRSACSGEIWKGAAKGKQNVVLLTLGTGIGGAIVLGGKMLNGGSGLAGELGHMTIVHNGEECGCGGKGCYEKYASTSALIKQYEDVAKRIGTDTSHISGEFIMDQVNKGNEAAVRVYNNFIQYLVAGLLNVSYLFNPEAIIIGGGITSQGETFMKDIRSAYDNQVMSIYRGKTTIVPTELQNDAGMYGACYSALQLL